MQPSELQSRLEAEVLEVEWDALRPHHSRDALIYVAPELPLVKVAMAVSLDLKNDVEGWMKDGSVAKVTEAHVAEWTDEQRFRFLIVQPFVLIQTIADDADEG